MSKKEDLMEIEDTVKSEDTSNDQVLERYKLASQIVNETLAIVYKEAVPGKYVYELCELGDKTIEEKLKGVYKKKKDLQKGIAFPTCVNVNEIVCHYAPYKNDNEESNVKLKDNDVVRIDLAVHVDGYVATAATTKFLIKEEKLDGKAGNMLAAADVCLKAALRLFKPGNTNKDVAKLFASVAEAFQVNLAEGVLSHQLKRYVIDGSRCIIQKPLVDQDVETFTFKEHEAYGLDIVLTTGEGKFRETESRTTIYKRDEEIKSQLKRNSAISTLKEIKEKYNNFPFNIKYLDQKVAKLGITELKSTGLVTSYPVLCEKNKQIVVQLKSTVLITGKEVLVTTGHALQNYVSEYKPTKEIFELLKE